MITNFKHVFLANRQLSNFFSSSKSNCKKTFHSSINCWSKFCETRCGIIGLPNVGKSLLFNALVGRELAVSANYPFTTIKPNTAKVSVPNLKLQNLAAIVKSKKVTFAQLEFVDVAGLIEGASDGKGLGNQIFDEIKNTSLLVHMIRCFGTDGPYGLISHVLDNVDPVRDINIVNKELIRKDLEVLGRFTPQKLKQKCEQHNFDCRQLSQIIDEVHAALDSGRLARSVLTQQSTAETKEMLHSLQLLTSKPILYVCNVEESSVVSGNVYTKQTKEFLEKSHPNSCVVIVSAKLENELTSMKDTKLMGEFLEEFGLKCSGVEAILQQCQQQLELKQFYTVNANEARAWFVSKNAVARTCAGMVHSDMEHGFIKAEVISYDDFIRFGLKRAKLEQKIRYERPNYILQDNDIVWFKFK
jgi:GTP-binding protein YchF